MLEDIALEKSILDAALEMDPLNNRGGVIHPRGDDARFSMGITESLGGPGCAKLITEIMLPILFGSACQGHRQTGGVPSKQRQIQEARDIAPPRRRGLR